MKRNTLTTITLTGLAGLAGLASIARAHDLENTDLPESFLYKGNNCAVVYGGDYQFDVCWDEERAEPLISRKLNNGCVWEYYDAQNNGVYCESDLAKLPIPQQTYRHD